jgi:uncharacterized protein (TIGR03437 family)
VQRLLRIPAERGQQVSSLKTDAQGNLIVAAFVQLPDSIAPRVYTSIKKIDPSGNEWFSRILPGVAGLIALAVDSHDDIYIAGATPFPGTFPFTIKLNVTAEAAFLMKLRGRDGTIVYSTSWGNGIAPAAIAVDAAGQVLLAGTASFTGATFQTTPGAYASPLGFMATPMYLLRFSQAGDQILFSARYGGQNKVCQGSACVAIRFTSPSQILLDAQGNIWVAGNTNTTDLPVTANAVQSTCGCGMLAGDGFLAQFSPDASRLLYATYLGTSEIMQFVGGNDVITAAAAGPAGHIWIGGATDGADLPVTGNAIQKQYSGFTGGPDSFLLEYDPAANQLLYATYFGGDAADRINNLLIGPDGTVWFSGHSKSSSLPVPASGFTRGTDFLASLDPVTHTITIPTKLGNGSTGSGLALSPAGLAVSGAANIATLLQPGAGPSLFAVTNAGGTAITGQVAPGEIISLYGAGIGPSAPVIADLTSGQAPAQLAGVQVLVDGKPAPVLYTQSDQINAILPFTISGDTHVAITNGAATSNEALLGVVSASPEALKKNARLWAAVLNEDGTVNSDTNRAKPGSVVSVFGTGFGALSPIPPDGRLLTGTLPSLTASVQVSLVMPYSQAPLEVLYAGPAPTLVAGAIQVNFRLPADSLVIPEPQFSFTVDGWQSGPFVVLTQ